MIDVGNVSFACDECGICEQLEWRSRVAQELGETLQFDHCSCAKVGDEFWAGGYCGDAFIKNPPKRDGGNRKTGRAYRRRMHRKNIQKYRDRDSQGRPIYGPHIHGHWDEDEYILGAYVEYPKSSKNKVFYKRVSNKKSAAVKTSRPMVTDIAKCLTTGGRLLRG